MACHPFRRLGPREVLVGQRDAVPRPELLLRDELLRREKYGPDELERREGAPEPKELAIQIVEAPGVRTAKDLAVVSRLFGEPAPPAKKRRL